MKKTKIVIIGGGFGGVFSAKYLKKYNKHFDIELISIRNYFVFQPLLPEIASGTLNPQDAVTPLRVLLPNINIRLAEVKNIDFNNKTVTVLQGRKTVIIKVPYDHLIIATGQVTDLSLFQGFEQHSMTMKDVIDAHKLRNHVIKCLELADVTKNHELKRSALTFVVAGGGFSGVETIGEMAEMIRRTLKYYPNIKKSEIRLILIQRDNRVLPEMAESLSEYAKEALTKAGVDVRLEVGIKSATATQITTSDGNVIHNLTSVTTIGNGPSPFLKSIGLELNRGKIAVESTLAISGHKNAWALGDCALIPMPTKNGVVTYAPPTAQFALQQASFLAKNIIAETKGNELANFNYKPLGMLASLGNYKGVATIAGISVKGLIAWIIWRGLYIGMLPGFPTRLRVALNWMFDYFMPRTIVHMAHEQSVATEYIHYAKGDIVFNEGQVLKGLYTVVSGSFEMTITEKNGSQRVKTFVTGSHWGERILQQDIFTTGKVIAMDDSVVMMLKREDFKRLYSDFTPFHDYFNSLKDELYSDKVKDVAKKP